MLPRLMSRTQVLTGLAVTGLGLAGGLLARMLGLPLPFVLGPLVATSLLAILRADLLPTGFRYPDAWRAAAIAVIGVTIGARVTWEVLAALPQAAFSFAALTLFVPLVQVMNYQIFTRIGKYDRVTAFFAAAPGGLIEAMVMGEAAGADARLLTVQQFMRIICVLTLLPVGLSLWYGAPIGSGAGISLARADAGITHLPEVALLGLLGLGLGHVLRLPAGQLLGPMLLGGAANLSGLAVVEIPQWLISMAQLIIGASLGLRFAGVNFAMLLRAVGLGVLSVAGMLLIGGGLALAIAPLAGEHFDVLLISFAPGGVTEMALVALSLNANPAFVTIHHLYRIILTVVMLVWAARRWQPRA
ncbi:AbrB family transcriptional regulator [Pseudooceanicola aestuarii]|uniref:AbrB family transcriptional regulator n=1 Tax=Pseudooceanicola aestuarii TaxID=2697319 RepID=UPI0013D8DA91|nr:AbrB family transcriptional regulator [Pseudooceanicola aestuarii]